VILTRKPTYDDAKIPDVFHPDGPRLNLLLLLLREFGREKVKEGLIKYLKTA
jgi:hypothetical protein